MSSTIALLSPYFGPLPFWMPAFLLSCRDNPGIDWHILSDNPQPTERPVNVFFHHMTLDQFKELISTQLKIQPPLTQSNLIKVCDFRPAFGIVFQDLLHDYRFWGHCDIDVVWGNISSFITPSMLDSYDIITSRYKLLSGSFTLYRNSAPINSLYRSILGFNRLVGNGRHFNVDEKHMSRLIKALSTSSDIRQALYFLGRKRPPRSPRVYWDRILTTSGGYQRQIPAKDSSMKWDNGRVYGFYGEEFMYLHFHKMKNTMKSTNFSYTDSPSRFHINHTGIHHVNQGYAQVPAE
ncbi:DUF6625 family protein [Desulfofustis glycolicus]|uniref:Uncharacterized protein n=1 Tax=Desulfofustis glycolicus DSM 9705 TaxID=1121409 RepID=A0A1M5Y7A8_9BACT|nr:DUF6625 family protein [Desulfofustis glycolicus]MCB2216856.1 hypothetical protein [Desulfobulbaceae bacterium]SHI07694.1 hypothetical protein SAMN02745124_03687 [Desulfofustis glycolicus DSM 9705]